MINITILKGWAVNLEQAKEIVKSVIIKATENEKNIHDDMILIGGEGELDSVKLVEICLALEDVAEENGFEFDWTSENVMSRSRSIFRNISALSKEFAKQSEVKKIFKSLKEIDNNFLENNISDFHEYSSDSLMNKFLREHKPFKTQKETFTYFNKLIKKENVHLFPILIENKKVIGTVSLSLLNEYRKDWIIGFASSSKYWGQPIITLTISAVIGICFIKYNAHRIEGLTQIDNLRAQNLLENLGFKEEGTKRSYYRDDNNKTYIDAKIYGLLSSEFLYLNRFM